MIRAFVVAFLSCFAASAWAQTQPVPAATPAQTGAPAKPPAKKPAPKPKTSAKPAGPVESGPCQIGVIPVIGDQFVVQKIGLTIFNNEYTEVPIDSWGLDDLVVARIRAVIGPGTGVRRIAYARAAFAPYDHPAPALFRNIEGDLTAIVQQITATAGCERYVVVTKFSGQLEGTNITLRGIGVYNRGIGSLISHTRLFTSIQVTVFDGQTYAIHKKPFNPAANLGAAFTRALAGEDPLTKLDNAAFPEPATGAASSAVLRDHTRALVIANLDKILSAHLKEE